MTKSASQIESNDRPRFVVPIRYHGKGMTYRDIHWEQSTVRLIWPDGKDIEAPVVRGIADFCDEEPELLEPFQEAINKQIQVQVERCEARTLRGTQGWWEEKFENDLITLDVTYASWIPTTVQGVSYVTRPDGIRVDVPWEAYLERYEDVQAKEGLWVQLATYRLYQD